ncbi:hypothetical protein OQA88_4557 [Cercophora sp. LCS_1]
MRLLNATTLRVEEFFNDVPPHAILSHTWGDEEMTLADMETIARHRQQMVHQEANGAGTRTPSSDVDGSLTPLILPQVLTASRRNSLSGPLGLTHPLERKKGFSKVLYACSQAEKDDFQYVWVDTCCIDKTSSSELSEAINSMFSWYQSAKVCYAYLEDVQRGNSKNRIAYRSWKDDFARSRWFTRGWTLQELLAPRDVRFFGAGWEELGTKASLYRLIETTTGIDRRTLAEPNLINKASIARRMSWAAHRRTTRVEDTAYCLIGIFGVSMPLLYGEGDNAFLRLQEEIIRRSSDQTILAWGILNQEQQLVTHHVQVDELQDSAFTGTMPTLAQSPRDFAGMGRVVRAPAARNRVVDYRITNMGLQIELNLIELGVSRHTGQTHYAAALDCHLQSENPQDRLGILLTETEASNVLLRTVTTESLRISDEDMTKTQARLVYISTSVDDFSGYYQSREERLFVVANDLVSPGYEIAHVEPKYSQWNPEFRTMRLMGLTVMGTEGKEDTDAMVYQLVVIVFFNRHLGTGFVTRILVDRASGACFVDMAGPRTRADQIDRDEKRVLKQLKADADSLWQKPGSVNLPAAGLTGKLNHVETVAIINPDTHRTEADSEVGESVAEEPKVKEPGRDLCGQILIPEKWEREHQRMVEAKVSREKKDVIVLEMKSLLFAT